MGSPTSPATSTARWAVSPTDPVRGDGPSRGRDRRSGSATSDEERQSGGEREPEDGEGPGGLAGLLPGLGDEGVDEHDEQDARGEGPDTALDGALTTSATR
ncbi:hypothetical protein MOPEL_007_00450 [Mobilicoccus pelagius NBRC 104925]|uniref:Uncharacterized protein n=1 Tax=Mobilicoccus pelagius NBRC 104925 TaxID=1089455 RepID=H5UNC0_9MICO|nr:hypothetical protein MOPEL_007_00450 [Mobilicoccus pelagius NBRC 104925]